MSDDEDRLEVCGESYDHDLRVVAKRDGWVTYECRECGAEVVEEPVRDDETEGH